MGYGARISTGCNIGAMVVGIASGSLHGWAWMALAFLGSIAGVLARPVGSELAALTSDDASMPHSLSRPSATSGSIFFAVWRC
jgi:hypothetical protein